MASTLLTSSIAAAASAQARTRAAPCYVLLQTGFDDCRQFFQHWAAWQQQPDATALSLHYLIIAPLAALRRPSPSPSADAVPPALAQQLDAVWPTMTPGYHRVLLAQGRVVLNLIIGDIASSIHQLDATVDCFLLQQDAVWTSALLQRLARLAAPQAQLHLAGADQLEQQLQQAGFQLRGEVAHFAPRWSQSVAARKPPAREAIVIGAGLAGSAVCERLTARGWQVTLVEQHAQAAQEASGNLAGVYMPAISRDDNPTARLSRSAFLFALQLWRALGILDPARGIGQACGVLQLARDAEQATAFEQAAQHWRYPADYAQWLSAAAASDMLGMATASGWWFAQGGWLRPGAVCEAMLHACGTRLQRRFDHHVAALRREAAQWQVLDDAGQLIAQAPVVILANGMQALRFEQARGLPLQAIRGQVSHVPQAQLPSLSVALCGDGYLTGAVDGLCSLGASYDQDDERALRLDSHLGNLAKLQQMLPQWQAPQETLEPQQWQGRVGFRCVSADRLPLVGELPDMQALSDAGEVQLRTLPRHTQLFGLMGYASRGLIWAPLAAEIVACQLNGEPAPLGKDALALFDPARFALKAHRRG